MYQEMQQVYAGRRPTRPSAVRKEDGQLTQDPTEVLIIWHQHFCKLLNQQSTFSDEVIQQMPMLPPCLNLDGPPTEVELEAALSKMKLHKAGGKTGFMPELVVLVVESSGTGC